MASAMLTSQSANTIASPISDTVTTHAERLGLHAAGRSRRAPGPAAPGSPAASRPSSTSPAISATAIGFEQLAQREVPVGGPRLAPGRPPACPSPAAAPPPWPAVRGSAGRCRSSRPSCCRAPRRGRAACPAPPRRGRPPAWRRRQRAPPLPAGLPPYPERALAPAVPMPHRRLTPAVLRGPSSRRTGSSPASMPSASSPGPEISSRYSSHRSASSSWCRCRPRRPRRSSTAIRSARFSVDRRCAISSVVRPAMTRCRVAWISASIRGSTAEVASSSSSSLGSVISARASATRCRCPPERVRPCSPITVS